MARGSSSSISVTVTLNQATVIALNSMPVLMQKELLNKALPAAGRIVRDRARQLAPDGEKSGNTKKQSKKTKQVMRPELRLRDTIAVKIKRYANRLLVMVGPKHPDGNDAFFNFGVKSQSRRVVYWGRQTGKQRPMTTEHVEGGGLAPAFLAKAIDETKAAQIMAVEDAVNVAIRKARAKQLGL